MIEMIFEYLQSSGFNCMWNHHDDGSFLVFRERGIRATSVQIEYESLKICWWDSPKMRFSSRFIKLGDPCSMDSLVEAMQISHT